MSHSLPMLRMHHLCWGEPLGHTHGGNPGNSEVTGWLWGKVAVQARRRRRYRGCWRLGQVHGESRDLRLERLLRMLSGSAGMRGGRAEAQKRRGPASTRVCMCVERERERKRGGGRSVNLRLPSLRRLLITMRRSPPTLKAVLSQQCQTPNIGSAETHCFIPTYPPSCPRTSKARSCTRMDVSAHSRLASCTVLNRCRPAAVAAAATAEPKPRLRWRARAKEAAREAIACR
eukprot:1142063-Pelagomonas_calceolata.AAC.2